jgi:hypothetical protein
MNKYPKSPLFIIHQETSLNCPPVSTKLLSIGGEWPLYIDTRARKQTEFTVINGIHNC